MTLLGGNGYQGINDSMWVMGTRVWMTLLVGDGYLGLDDSMWVMGMWPMGTWVRIIQVADGVTKCE